MRLWHYKLIPFLPRLQLLGQHREICALRGKGWGKKHSKVNYVFNYNYIMLFYYHLQVIKEMERRNYIITYRWKNKHYRGKILGYMKLLPNNNLKCNSAYPEHNKAYLKICLNNLKLKGIEFNESEKTKMDLYKQSG